MGWFSKNYSRPVEKAPSKYRIVPKGENSWGIQEYGIVNRYYYRGDHKYEYQDVIVIYNDYHVQLSTITYFSRIEGYKYFCQGTMDECKSFIDRRLVFDNKLQKVKDREADTLLYLDYP